MEAFEDLVMKKEQFLENVKIIYDAEASIQRYRLER